MERETEFLELAKEIAIKAGTFLQSGLDTVFNIEKKPGKQNLVTEYDKKSEKLIIDAISKKFPHHGFLGEEGGAVGSGTEEIIWIIDPLDGTVNFAHGIPIFCVSIAAVKENDILCGVIYDPSRKELFWAKKGGGAYLNNKKIKVSNISNLEDAMIVTGFPYDVDQDPLHCIEQYARMLRTGTPIRKIGSAALELAYVACGRSETYFEIGIHPWDCAAGILLIQEAGGKVTHYNGSKRTVFSEKSVLASNGKIHEAMIENFKPFDVYAD